MTQKDFRVEVEKESFEDYKIITHLGKFATRNQVFLDRLFEVRTRMTRYLEKQDVTRPLNILLAAPPGSGKSFLIKQLVSSAGQDRFAFEEVYVASFDDVSELLGVFQRAQSVFVSGKVPVVFFDEVDSKVSGSPIYKRFLSPMWDGTFFIGKDKFHLGRSIFFFAGSTLSLEEESQKILDQSNQPLSYKDYLSDWQKAFEEHWTTSDQEKITDFLDRIDVLLRLPPLHPRILGEDYDREIQDLVLLLISKHHPKVRRVGRIAFDFLCSAQKSKQSLRPVEKIIFASEVHDEDLFDIFCLPTSETAEVEIPSEVRKSQRESSGVRIVIQAEGAESR